MSYADDLTGFIVAGFALTGSPGPATLGLAAAAAAFGIRSAIVLAAGCIAGVIAVMLVTATGLTGLVLAQPILGPVVKGLSGAYMLYLAWRIASAPPLDDAAPSRRAPSFLAGTLLGIGNPKAYAAMAALFSGFRLPADRAAADLPLKFSVLVVILLIVDAVWLIAGAALTRAFRDPTWNRAVNIVFALLLIASLAVTFV